MVKVSTHFWKNGRKKMQLTFLKNLNQKYNEVMRYLLKIRLHTFIGLLM